MTTRRHFLTRGVVGLGLVGGAALAIPGDAEDRTPGALPDGSASKGMITAESERAVKKGLAYLANRRRGGSFGMANYAGNVAVSSLAGLAFLANGSQPGRGHYGKVLNETVRFILDQENRGGRFPGFLNNPTASPAGPMYGHGFATLFLGEVYGMVHEEKLRRELRDKLRLALKLIEDSQNHEGGWRYQPYSKEADLSVTVCQIMALRSARNAGFAVRDEVVKKCIDYVRRCQDQIGGWFKYTLQGGGPNDGFARTGAGLSAFYSAGVYKGQEIEAGLRYLLSRKPTGARMGVPPEMEYYYGHYYAAQAMWTAGGKYWTEWFPAIREELIGRQEDDDSWRDRIDPHYATAMACIILQIPNNYLPILQK